MGEPDSGEPEINQRLTSGNGWRRRARPADPQTPPAISKHDKP